MVEKSLRLAVGDKVEVVVWLGVDHRLIACREGLQMGVGGRPSLR